MRFGMFVPQGWRMDLVGIEPAQQWESMVNLARHADDGDVFESIWVYDHFHTVPQPSGEATHEAWSLMAGFGAATSRVRLGQMCTCMGYRNPAYLAKVAATVDVISGGRTDLVVGRGSFTESFPLFGLDLADYDSLFTEKLDLLLKIRESEKVTWSGQHRAPLTGQGVAHEHDPALVAGDAEPAVGHLADVELHDVTDGEGGWGRNRGAH